MGTHMVWSIQAMEHPSTTKAAILKLGKTSKMRFIFYVIESFTRPTTKA